jgi:hypothetical protein
MVDVMAANSKWKIVPPILVDRIGGYSKGKYRGSPESSKVGMHLPLSKIILLKTVHIEQTSYLKNGFRKCLFTLHPIPIISPLLGCGLTA